jgi:hypothetical protein
MSPPYAIWIDVWKWVLTIGLGFYFLIVLVTIPLGALDIRKLFRKLDAQRKARESNADGEGI